MDLPLPKNGYMNRWKEEGWMLRCMFLTTEICVGVGVQLTHMTAALGDSSALLSERRPALTHLEMCRCLIRACASWCWERGPCRCRACAPSQPSTWPSPASACQPTWRCTPCSDPSSQPPYPPPAWASSFLSLTASCRSAGTQLLCYTPAAHRPFLNRPAVLC